jgi:hypothetical protein
MSKAVKVRINLRARRDFEAAYDAWHRSVGGNVMDMSSEVDDGIIYTVDERFIDFLDTTNPVAFEIVK